MMTACGVYMPLARTYCVRTPGHKSCHRAKYSPKPVNEFDDHRSKATRMPAGRLSEAAISALQRYSNHGLERSEDTLADKIRRRLA